jgi:hypothetical protein
MIAAGLESWIAAHKASLYHGTTGMLTQKARDAVRALNTANNALPTPANMQVTGDTAKVAAGQQTLYAAQQSSGATSDPAIDAMLANPASGLMHVSDLARIANNWNPTNLVDGGANSTAYQNYVNSLVKFPLVTLNMATRQHITRTSSDWNDVIDSIASTFQGIADKDKGAIVSGLKNLAQAASSTMSTTEQTNVFVQNALNVANDTYEFYLYNSQVKFQETKGKGYDTKQSEFDVVQVKVTLVSALWTRENVAKIIGQTSASLDDWLKSYSTATTGTSSIPALNG